MSFSTPTPRRRAPPRRTAQQVFDLSGSQASSAAPSLASAASSTAGVFTPRLAVPTPLAKRTFPSAAFSQDEQMTDVATFDGTASVGGSSVFGGSILSELPDDDDRARVRKASARPREVWMNDGRVEVWKKGGLPSAVQYALDQSGQFSAAAAADWGDAMRRQADRRGPPPLDLYTNPLSASFSEQTGFASLITHSALYVWSYLVRHWKRRSSLGQVGRADQPLRTLSQKPNSTLYVFPLAPPASSHPSMLPSKSHALLLPFPSSASASVVSREPSVLVVSPAGELRFWDSLSAALVDGGTRYVASDAIGSLLGDGESIDGLWSAGDGLGAVATGDKGGLWKVDISYPGGRAQVDVVPFPRATSAGFLGFFRSSASSSSAYGSAVGSQPTLVLPLESGQLLVLTPQSILQTYSLPSASRSPVLVSSTPLLPAVLAALRADERDGVELSLEMHDLRPLSSAGEIGVLVSYEETGMLEGGRRSAIIGVTAGAQGDAKVSRVIESSTRIVSHSRTNGLREAAR